MTGEGQRAAAGGRRVCVLGVGVTGCAVAADALGRGDAVVVYTGADTPDARGAGEKLCAAGADVRYDDTVQGDFDLCVPSPGIPETSAFYRAGKEHARAFFCEPEYAWRLFPQRWIAVTGTNGKTTTVALVSHLLAACGLAARPCGNTQAQTTLQAACERAGEEFLVAELSSFQLASTCTFSPQVAVLLNISSDHLAWHGSPEAYAQAKLGIFAHLAPGSTAVVAAGAADMLDCEVLRARGVRVVVLGSRTQRDRACLGEDGFLHVVFSDVADRRLCRADELSIPGAHNVENALAAASAALAVGCDPERLADALRSFSALPHRIEFSGICDDVAFFDDSKATNVDATEKALASFAPKTVVLLAGGRDKMSPLDTLAAAARDACRAVVCYGEARERFAAELGRAGVHVEQAAGMREAFARACELAHPKDTVLLSPACASFDEFSGFAERGDVFKQLVAERSAAAAARA